MKYLIILMILSSCGQAPRCRSKDEMVYTCMAQDIAKYGNQPWIEGQCKSMYPVEACW
jgi:hypothetical protein